MGTPTQDRAIDPFSSYGSDVVNKLSRGVSRNNIGLLSVSDLLVSLDSTSPVDTVVAGTGFAYISDVLIQISSNHRVDMTGGSNYVTPNPSGDPSGFSNLFSETGYYYLVLEYVYAKSRPAPTAKIKLLRPSESSHSSLGTSLLFLKAIRVQNIGGSNQITSLHDYDPTDPTKKRLYVNLDISAITELPTFDASQHMGVVRYEVNRNKYWFGFDDRWEEISAGVSVSINTDSTALQAGMLAYVDSAGNAQPASASGGITTRAEMAVLELGTSASGNGRARLAGVIDSVLVETGQTIGRGNVVYLSDVDDGKVTASRPAGSYQVVGKAMTAGSDAVPIQLLFFPGDIIFSAVSGSIDPVDWDSTAGLIYYDVDITRLNLTVNSVLVNCWTAGHKISPDDVEIRDAGDTCRIYMPTAALTVDYTVSDGAGGGSAAGGGGSSSHAVLSNLDYASAGHTGFAPDPHNNGEHSETYITAAGVTYANMNANGDVGTGAAQVSQGNHSHTDLADVPSGETILFEKDTAVTGYTLLTSHDDGIVFISKGSGAGGEAGGSLKTGGTWTQPGHTHTTGDHTLVIGEIPSHDHDIYTGTGDVGSTYIARIATANFNLSRATELTGGGAAHNHGDTGSDATVSSWRPKGMNFTRQRRN